MTDQEILNTFYELYDPCKFECYDKDILEFARALLSKAIPEGYVVVPKRPTREMLIAAGFDRFDGEDQWSAMIAAAPSVEGEGA